MRRRHYDAPLGRFVTRDPAGGRNLYAYARHRPINLIDPSGLTETKYFSATANKQRAKNLLGIFGEASSVLQSGDLAIFNAALDSGQVSVEFGTPKMAGLKGYTHKPTVPGGQFILQIDKKLSRGVAALVLIHEFYHFMAETDQFEPCDEALKSKYTKYHTDGALVEWEQRKHVWVYKKEALAYKSVKGKLDKNTAFPLTASELSQANTEGAKVLAALEAAQSFIDRDMWDFAISAFQVRGFSIWE